MWIAADSADGAREVSINTAEEFLRKNSVSAHETTKDIDDFLFELTNKKIENAEPLLCLRCRASRPVYFEIISLHNKYKSQYSDLEKEDMAACVLNDSGDIYLRSSNSKSDGSSMSSRRQLNWDVFLEMKDRGYRPFGVEVIQTYKPDKGVTISTWAKRKVLGNAELKKYFRSSGLLLISPWALIADTSSKRVRDACEAFGLSGDQLTNLQELHSSYLDHYPLAKDQFRKQTGKNYGWEPDKEFLESLSPKQENDENLRLIDQSIRNYLFCGKYILISLDDKEEKLGNLSDFTSVEEEDLTEDGVDLMMKITKVLRHEAFPVLKEAIASDRLKWEKKPERKLVWELYSQGFSQRDIASRCERGQAFVSKLLKEKFLTESIAQESALELIKLPEFRSASQDPAVLDRMIEGLRNHLLSSEQEGDKALISKWIFEIIN